MYKSCYVVPLLLLLLDMELMKLFYLITLLVLSCIVLVLLGTGGVNNQMHYHYNSMNTSKPTKPTSKPDCCKIAEDTKLEVLCQREPYHDPISTHCSCTEYMTCKLVVVTGISSNHFQESRSLFGSVHEQMPNTKIIVYDIGLTKSQVSTLQTYCNVEIRKFNFQKYPEYFKNVKNYAWKTAVVKEISEEFELFLFCDASIRFKNPVSYLLPFLLRFPFVPGSMIHDYIVGRTHDGMLKYLHMNMTRSELARFNPSLQSGVYIMWVTPLIKEKFLVPWINCGMHKECFSPEGATVGGCRKIDPTGGYIGCHRYDQSAMNMILIREFGASLFAIFKSQMKDTNFVVKVNRTPDNFAAKIRVCTKE